MKRWQHGILLEAKARRNLAKWGRQDFETLGLAVAEEAGELAQAILQARHEVGDPDRIRREAIDLGALCIQVMDHFPDGYPLHQNTPAHGPQEDSHG